MTSIDRRAFLQVSAGAWFAAGLRPAAAAPVLSVVGTTGMIADALRSVGGDRVAVQGLMGEGVDPHTYRQTRSDIAAMVKADAVFRHGLYLEAQLEDFFADFAQHRRLFTLAEAAVPAERLLAHDEYKDRFDPHVWMDPRMWSLVVRAAGDALTELDPAGREVHAANLARTEQAIEAVAAYADEVLASVPAETRVLVTAHDAFNYFGRAYGYEVLGIQGISTESEAGLATVESFVDVLVNRGIRAIFVESSVSDRNVKALIEGAAARGHTVTIGGQIYSDAMGRPGTYEGTYVGMIDHNATVIARALGGTAPAAGLNGRLGAVN
ncbi:metal ABC transporter solute-binding protein, Zn/Mn family [Chthonobacter rhizosphaerae]|uniref:metal ABC transporter solute-binding protein, Zn/Mn family n=1 Tax=Chthonobacter rhizosphaerae TaxID=2735553 RepID=UPI0015EF0556|nr:zinc ABC transporter substrate-binding protein [Chthonobacter rhizosphaerae]